MANKDDYLVDYSKFFKNFAETLNPNDPLPVKLASYKLLNTEVIGGVIDWTTQYLNQKNCPKSLIAPLINITIHKTREKCKLDPRACGFNVSDNAYEPLKLMQSVVAGCNEICSLYLDNSLLCSLPPPNDHYHRHPVSVYAVKNGRRRMEDRHVVIHDLNTILNLHEDVTPSSYYAVFDGHAGHDAAVYSATHLHQYLGESEYFADNPEKALTEAFFKTDGYFVQKCEVENFSSGTTAVCALLRPKEKYLYVAWAGDSMALIANKGQILQCVVPHKPDREDEQERIRKAGGAVVFWGTWRVNGQLAVSRAIGDVDFKPSVVATPEIQKIALDGDEDFIILACDGLWDFVKEDMAAKEVYTSVCINPEGAEDISQVLVKLAKANNSSDNISVIVVFLRDPRDIAADTQWLLETTNASEDASRQQEQDTAGAMDAAAGLDNNASNRFANNDAATTGEHVQKDPFLLDMDSFKQQTTDLNSAPNNDLFLGLEHNTNGKRVAAEMFDDDDDFGPETNVDGDGIDTLQPEEYINDKYSFSSKSDEKMEAVKENDREDEERFHDEPHLEQMSPILLAAKAIAEGVNNINSPVGLLDRLEEEMDLAMEKEFNQGGNEFEQEKIIEKEVADDVHDGNLVDNVADSGDDSEDEWNYFKGNTAADTDKENIDPTEKARTVDNLEGDDFDMSQLNPNAAEFVPVSPTRNAAASPPHMALLNDTIYAQSPKRAPNEPIDLDVPEPNDFESEIRSRPSDVASRNNGHAEPNDKRPEEDLENLLNGKNVVENDFQPAKSTENFHFGPNATPFSTPAKFLDDSEAFSTKANFGDESTATYLDCTTSFSPDKNVSTDSNNPFGDQTDFQAIMNKESDPMSMSFYQDKDDKSDTNPFDLNKVQMLPDDLDTFLAKPDEQNPSCLPVHGGQVVTDLDKPSQDEDLLSGVRELPKSPFEEIVTPEPTFDENLCPNNEIIEKENIENVCENIDRRNESMEINELCGQIKHMTVNDTSFAYSEIELQKEEPKPIPEEVNFIEQQVNIEYQFVEQPEEPLLCVMTAQEGTGLIECHLMTTPQFENERNEAISPEPINQEIPTPEAVFQANDVSPQLFESPLIHDTSVIENKSIVLPVQPEVEEIEICTYLVERELIETPVDEVTSSIKDDTSPIQLPPTELIPDLPIEESLLTVVPEEKSALIVETAVATVAGAAAVATATIVSKKAQKDTPQKKPTISKNAATPKSASKVSATTPKVGATSPTKSTPKPLAVTKALTPRPSPVAKPSNASSTGKLSAAAPRPKITPVSTKPPSTKPLQNGEPKTLSKPLPAAKPRVGTLSLTKTTVPPAKPVAATRSSPTKPPTSTRPATAPAATKATTTAKPPSTFGAVSKPKPTATSAARATSATSKLSTTSVTKVCSVTKSASSTVATANKVVPVSKTCASVPAKARAPITRTVPPKAPDAEKQNKENVNKQTASRTAATGRTSAITNGKPTAITRKIEPKVAGIPSKTTVSKTTTAITTRLTTAIKKPTDTSRPITKTATKTVTKLVVNSKTASPKVNGLSNGLSETTTTTSTSVVENSDLINVDTAMVIDDLVLKDNSPIMENSQLINATAAD